MIYSSNFLMPVGTQHVLDIEQARSHAAPHDSGYVPEPLLFYCPKSCPFPADEEQHWPFLPEDVLVVLPAGE
jgi:hypothetical protein